MKYTIGERKAFRRPRGRSDRLLIVLCAVALGLLVYDYALYGNLMTYIFTGLK